MKKILLAVFLVGFLVIPMANLLAKVPPETPDPKLDVMLALEDIVGWLFTILLVIAAIAIVIAAYYFVTAAGNPETVSKARNFVLYALIGVGVAVAARGLVALVKRIVSY